MSIRRSLTRSAIAATTALTLFAGSAAVAGAQPNTPAPTAVVTSVEDLTPDQMTQLHDLFADVDPVEAKRLAESPNITKSSLESLLGQDISSFLGDIGILFRVVVEFYRALFAGEDPNLDWFWERFQEPRIDEITSADVRCLNLYEDGELIRQRYYAQFVAREIHEGDHRVEFLRFGSSEPELLREYTSDGNYEIAASVSDIPSDGVSKFIVTFPDEDGNETVRELEADPSGLTCHD